MESLITYLSACHTLQGERLTVPASPEVPFLARNPERLTVEVAKGVHARLVLWVDMPTQADLTIALGEGATLELVEVLTAESDVKLQLTQAAESRCTTTAAVLTAATLDMRIDLNGRGAQNTLGGVLLLGNDERGTLALRTAHNVPDCTSASTVRGVAGGRAEGTFHGLVYVAPDAQRTDARQQSRNVLLSDEARIETCPQLEIYADDVKCSHGATVGQMDDEAVYYMRQRGISAADARRLLLEGFVREVLMNCSDETLAEALTEEVIAAKMKMI